MYSEIAKNDIEYDMQRSTKKGIRIPRINRGCKLNSGSTVQSGRTENRRIVEFWTAWFAWVGNMEAVRESSARNAADSSGTPWRAEVDTSHCEVLIESTSFHSRAIQSF